MKNKKTSRRQFVRLIGLGSAGFALQTTMHGFPTSLPPASRLVYVGTYTTGRSEGIYICRLDLSSGELRRIGVAKGGVNPSFLTIDRPGRYLYAVNEVSEFQRKVSGAVSSFSIDPKTRDLKFLSQQPSAGPGPCHLALNAGSRFLLVANYDGGSVAVLPVRNGSLLPAIEMVQHHGAGLDHERQEGPHAHCVVLDKANRYLFVPDLGLDKVMIYRFDEGTGKLTANTEPAAKLKPGAGPRHFAFAPSGKWAYVINELNSTITAFAYDSAHGVLKELQSVSTLPADFSGSNSCAEIEVAPSGRFLYGSNRGHDSIVVLAIDPGTGRLNLVQHVPTQGQAPRNFAIDPAGDFLLAANQKSDNVVTFRVDRESGKLSPTGHTLEIPAPVCVAMSDKLY